MVKFTEVLPSKNAITWTPSTAGRGLLVIHDAKKSTDYSVQPLATSWGKSWTLTKLDGSERYCVLIGKEGTHDECDCAGQTFRPNAQHGCRHIQAIRAILANEFLWSQPAEEPVVDAEQARADLIASVWDMTPPKFTHRFAAEMI